MPRRYRRVRADAASKFMAISNKAALIQFGMNKFADEMMTYVCLVNICTEVTSAHVDAVIIPDMHYC